MAKLRVALIFGGKSVEHEVSIRSAKSIIENIDTIRFEVFLIYIDKNGSWRKAENDGLSEQGRAKFGKDVVLSPSLDPENPVFYEIRGDKLVAEHPVDVIFPVLHGTYGEDGTVQGMFELMDIAFVGASVLGSSIGMDKIVMKAVLNENDIPVVDYIGFRGSEWGRNNEAISKNILNKIGLPCFVKSADLGSSVGVTRVSSMDDLKSAVDYSCQFSDRILAERAVSKPREIEISVLGNEDPRASVPGEIVPHREFYDYTAKYLEDGTELIAPAELEAATVEALQDLAVKTYKALDCGGMGRVDFLIDGETGDIFVSEINTIPGFTDISMYPKLWEISGISYPELISNLIELALDRKSNKNTIETDIATTDINQ